MKAAGGVAPVKELLLWETFGGGGAVRLIEVAPDVWRVEIEDGNKEQSPFDFSFGCDELRALAVAAGRGVVLDGVRRDVLRIAAQLQEPCAQGCGEMGSCGKCSRREALGAKLARLVGGAG